MDQFSLILNHITTITTYYINIKRNRKNRVTNLKKKKKKSRKLRSKNEPWKRKQKHGQILLRRKGYRISRYRCGHERPGLKQHKKRRRWACARRWPCRWSSCYRTPRVGCFRGAERAAPVEGVWRVQLRQARVPNPPLINYTNLQRNWTTAPATWVVPFNKSRNEKSEIWGKETEKKKKIEVKMEKKKVPFFLA